MRISRLVRLSWFAVIIVALVISNWSLAVVSHKFGLPYLKPLPLAWLLSIPFDCAALVAGNLTIAYAREIGSNGSAPRMVVFALAGLSAWLNSVHASILHLGIPAHVLYATPPIVACVLFEITTHFEYRRALAEAGRTIPPLPVYGSATALLRPFGVLASVYAITGKRLENRTAKAMSELEIPGTARNSGKPRKQSDVRAWAKDNGYEVSNRGRLPAEAIAAYEQANAIEPVRESPKPEFDPDETVVFPRIPSGIPAPERQILEAMRGR